MVGAVRFDLREGPDQPLAAAGDHQGLLLCGQQVHDLHTAVADLRVLAVGSQAGHGKDIELGL